MSIRRLAAVVGSAVVVMAGTLAIGATPASATETGVWVQSYQRPGPDAPCDSPKELDIAWQDSWGSPNWTPSWEQWPNGGTGGWTCTRQIKWANVGPFGPGCVLTQNLFLDFGTQYTLPPGTYAFEDGGCTIGTISMTGVWAVYAPSEAQAQTLCDAVSPGSVAMSPPNSDPNLYGCFTT